MSRESRRGLHGLFFVTAIGVSLWQHYPLAIAAFALAWWALERRSA